MKQNPNKNDLLLVVVVLIGVAGTRHRLLDLVLVLLLVLLATLLIWSSQ